MYSPDLDARGFARQFGSLELQSATEQLIAALCRQTGETPDLSSFGKLLGQARRSLLHTTVTAGTVTAPPLNP